MIKKIIAASLALALMVALMPTSFADSGNAKHYNGLVGADSPFYSIKTNLQKLDVLLTFNNTEKLKKQINLANERIAEAEDAVDDNNTGAYDAATGDYLNTLNDINGTLQAEDIDSDVATELLPTLLHHKDVFYGILDNNSTPLTIQNRTVLINGEFMKIKNGMPFYYYNDTAYFIPPGQMKKVENGIINGSKVPPGLANKGYKNATYDKTNKTWPWDQIPYPTSQKTNGKGQGNPNK
jgi:Domain of unknown function (DUF5667)